MMAESSLPLITFPIETLELTMLVKTLKLEAGGLLLAPIYFAKSVPSLKLIAQYKLVQICDFSKPLNEIVDKTDLPRDLKDLGIFEKYIASLFGFRLCIHIPKSRGEGNDDYRSFKFKGVRVPSGTSLALGKGIVMTHICSRPEDTSHLVEIDFHCAHVPTVESVMRTIVWVLQRKNVRRVFEDVNQIHGRTAVRFYSKTFFRINLDNRRLDDKHEVLVLRAPQPEDIAERLNSEDEPPTITLTTADDAQQYARVIGRGLRVGIDHYRNAAMRSLHLALESSSYEGIRDSLLTLGNLDNASLSSDSRIFLALIDVNKSE